MTGEPWDYDLTRHTLHSESIALKITFLLPGYAPNPIGGYKVVYEYANYLAGQEHDVKVLHAWRFSHDEAGVDKPVTMAQRGRYLPQVLANAKPTWFDLHPSVKVINKYVAFSRDLDGSDVVVATACQSAPITNEHSLSGKSVGVYFIQHYEDWSKDSYFVERTWKLPLRKIVIAPWLQDIGKTLRVQTDLVLNAIDSTKFQPGPAIPTRPLGVTAMLSDHEWKRTDLVREVLAQAKAQVPDMEATTFGVAPRPAELPAWVKYTQRPTHEQLSGIYQQARVFLCASDKEGWGLPPGEAMQSGAAVVTTRNGGVDAYAEGVSLMAEPGDGATLTAHVVRLLTDEAECVRLAVAGQVRLSTYTERDAGAAFEQIILEAAENYVG